MKKRLMAIVATFAMLFGITFATAPAASALTVTYYGTLRCVIGVHPVLSYTAWYKHYDYNWYEEQFLKKNDYTVWSHNQYHNYDYYPVSRCNVWGYIVPL